MNNDNDLILSALASINEIKKSVYLSEQNFERITNIVSLIFKMFDEKKRIINGTRLPKDLVLIYSDLENILKYNIIDLYVSLNSGIGLSIKKTDRTLIEITARMIIISEIIYQLSVCKKRRNSETVKMLDSVITSTNVRKLTNTFQKLLNSNDLSFLSSTFFKLYTDYNSVVHGSLSVNYFDYLTLYHKNALTNANIWLTDSTELLCLILTTLLFWIEKSEESPSLSRSDFFNLKQLTSQNELLDILNTKFQY